MSGSRPRLTVDIPSQSLPRLTSIPRNPKGWGKTSISIRGAGFSGALKFKEREPAGDPPQGWDGTRPEWAIYWGLLQLGLSEGEDFAYRPGIQSVGISYYSTLDFVVPDYHIAIEVQGEFWHYEQGSDRIFHDMQRASLLVEQGFTLIFIDGQDALEDPEYYTREALEGKDHSRLAGRV